MTDQIKPPAPADLLQCPHCGDDPVDHAIEPHEHALSIGDWKMPDHTGSHVIECGCGAGMIDETREAVAARWNKRPTPAPAPADHATVEQWEAALTAVMPSDFKDWHQNSRREWPNIAAHVIGNLRQREDEAWATVERLTATAPAPATGKPGLQVEQAPAVPAGAEPVSLAAAVRLGLEYAREALATHDQQFANHPATALERGSIVADIATMEASLASPVAAQEKKGGA